MITEINLNEIKNNLLIFSEKDNNATYHINSNDNDFYSYLKYLKHIIDKEDMKNNDNNYHYIFKIYDRNSYYNFHDIDPNNIDEFFSNNDEDVFFIFEFPDEETAFYFKLKYCN